MTRLRHLPGVAAAGFGLGEDGTPCRTWRRDSFLTKMACAGGSTRRLRSAGGKREIEREGASRREIGDRGRKRRRGSS